jgi:carboxylesterase type B
MRTRFIPLTLLAIALALGCSKPQPATQATGPQDPLEQVAQEAREAIKRQTQEANNELDEFAKQLPGAAQNSRTDVESRVAEEARRAKAKLSNQVDQRSQEMAEFAAEMAEDAKDQALEIPDVLDEFFGAPREERRSGGRPARPRR